MYLVSEKGQTVFDNGVAIVAGLVDGPLPTECICVIAPNESCCDDNMAPAPTLQVPLQRWVAPTRQVSNIRRTISQHLKYSRTVLRLSLPNPLKPDVKSRMKM